MTGFRRALAALARGVVGSTTVELALVVPVLVLLLVGILDLARALNAYVMVASASREGTRYAIVHPLSSPQQIAAAVIQRSVPLASDQLLVEASYWDGTAFRAWPVGGIPASGSGVSSVPVRVSVSYPWSATTFLVGGFIATGTGTATFTASSTMVADR